MTVMLSPYWVRVPASAMVLGAFGQNDKIGYAWNAPAGYVRAVIPAEELSTKFGDWASEGFQLPDLNLFCPREWFHPRRANAKGASIQE